MTSVAPALDPWCARGYHPPMTMAIQIRRQGPRISRPTSQRGRELAIRPVVVCEKDRRHVVRIPGTG
jgi:hypothetical protein